MANSEEDRRKNDRRKGDLDELFKRLVASGAFQDRRKGDRRKKQEHLNLRVYLN